MADETLSKASLERLLKTLLALGQEKPVVLLSLTQVPPASICFLFTPPPFDLLLPPSSCVSRG